VGKKISFLENNIRVYKERILLLLLKLELDSKLTLDTLLFEIISLGFCFNFLDFIFGFF
jgi:hypothetical protein